MGYEEGKRSESQQHLELVEVEKKSSMQMTKDLADFDDKKFCWFHVKVIIISGMGFFTDSYDLFSISLLTPLLGRLYYQDDPFKINHTVSPGKLPINVNAAVSAVALCGTLAGQLFIGHLGDLFGRKTVYGMTLVIMIFAAFVQAQSFGSTPNAVMGTLCFWRFILGLGVGGDYPLSASIMSEYASIGNRGAYVGAVFAMQGLGILTAAAVTIIVAAIFNSAVGAGKYPLTVPGCVSFTKETSATTSGACPLANQQAYWNEVQQSTPPAMDFAWRVILCFGAFPAALTLYFRNRLEETPRYKILQQKVVEKQEILLHKPSIQNVTFGELIAKWKYPLIGCAMAWCLLDIAFYSQNLFQKDVFLQADLVPPAKYMSGGEEMFKLARAQALIALGSTIPGYWFTVFFVDRVGRIPIQIMGFLLMTTFMAALAGSYKDLLNPNNADNTGLSSKQPANKNGWITMYAMCFFFANFGPNSTTFIIPAELFPTAWRTSCHGFCAAMGKAGAILGAFGFLYAAQPKEGSTTYSFPCTHASDLNKNGSCKETTNCPSGRTTPTVVGDYCACASPALLSGCFSYGIGLQASLGVLAATNFLGFLFTFLIPETANKTLEELNGEDKESDEIERVYNEKMVQKNGDTQMA